MVNMAKPDYGKRLREARERSGKSIDEMASLLGVSREWYIDLEDYDEEITNTLSLRQLVAFSKAISVGLVGFFRMAARNRRRALPRMLLQIRLMSI